MSSDYKYLIQHVREKTHRSGAMYLSYNNSNLAIGNYNKDWKLCVRCIKK